jgi:hypothetical protein
MKQIKFLVLSTLFSVSGYAQSNTSLVVDNDKAELKEDTLFFNAGIKIVVGQKLTVGNAAGANGKYRSIISGPAAIVPNIWGKNKNYENEIENYVDTKKGRASLAELIPGKLLTVKKILLMGKKSKPHYYLIVLSSGTNNFKSDIALALNLKELLLE